MDPDQNLPFEVGQVAESRSFLSGFRGAWFRCKVMAIRKKNNKLGCSLDFYDYPDEKQRWLQICQKSPYRSRKSQMAKESKDEALMLRPAFPHVIRESEMSQGHLPTSPNVAVVVRDVWAVGDLVDWWHDYCYWSCNVTKILQGDMVQVELYPSPVGEGGSYEVCSKDLRPSLDWSPEDGWTVPVSNGHGVCARLVQPQKEDEERASECDLNTVSAPFPSESSSDNSLGTEDGERENLDEKQDTDSFFRASSHGKRNHLEKKQDTITCSKALSSHLEETNVDRKHDIHSCFKATGSPGEGEAIRQEQEISSPSKAASSWREGKVLDKRQEIKCSKASTPLSEAKGGDKEHDIRSFRKTVSLGEGKAQGIGSSKPTSSHGERKKSGNHEIYLKRPRSGGCGSSLLYYDTIESSIVELEELVNKIRWLKGLLHFGVKWSNEMKSSWKLEPALHKSR